MDLHQDRREYGEFEIEKKFLAAGYTIVAPEKLSFADQLSILNNCDNIVVSEGSLAHTCIFCRPGTKVTIIRKANYINTYQLVVNELAGLDVTYIDANCSCPPYENDHIWNGPFYYSATPQLCKYLGRSSFSLPYWLSLSFWWYILFKLPAIQKKLSNRKFVRRTEEKLQRIKRNRRDLFKKNHMDGYFN